MVHVYLKNLRKSWIMGFVPPIIVIGFVGLVAFTFPSMLDIILERLAAMSNPIYKAILGDLGLEDLGLTWQAVLFMYGGGTVNIVALFVTIFIPARLLSTEIDKKTLDVMLSFPIPRWRYLLEKYSVYLTYSLLFPISIIALMIGSTITMNTLYPDGYSFTNPVSQQVEVYFYEIDFNLVVNYSIGIFLLLFALGAISLLCATLFLDSSKSVTVAGAIILAQYLLESMGGLFVGLGDIQYFSLFHYFKIGSILDSGLLPLGEVFVVIGVGIVALVGALAIFQRREFAL
jgi:ABC-type transport system involved in multi-copper enzyme maturation permease subunit